MELGMEPKNIVEIINNICLFRINIPAKKGSGLLVKDSSLSSVKEDLELLRSILEKMFDNYRDVGFKVSFSIGQGYFPSVLHTSILPPLQKVSDGIYVVICFDKQGRGVLVGCTESKTNPKALNTVKRSLGKPLAIDVDGFRSTTKYNDTFENPLEFHFPLTDDSSLIRHIKESLDLCLLHLGIKNAEELELTPRTLSNTKDDWEYEPNKDFDARERVATSIALRRGQREFRKSLIDAYKSKCAISRCSIVDILEAAHISPYNGQDTNHVQNGLLLRTDLHTLFDLGLITIDFSTYKVKISKILMDTEYKVLSGKKLKLPTDRSKHPSKKVLQRHNTEIFRGS